MNFEKKETIKILFLLLSCTVVLGYLITFYDFINFFFEIELYNCYLNSECKRILLNFSYEFKK